MEHRFLVETSKIEKTSFPFKTALSEANVKRNRMATTKWAYHREWCFASNYFFFFFFLRFASNVYIGIFRNYSSLILECFFPESILNNKNAILRYVIESIDSS